MAGLFDFDKTLLAALDARQKRDMYEQERADRNAQWQQSFDLQNKEFLQRAQQFRETIAQREKDRALTITENELNRKRDIEGENFKYRSQLSEDKWGIGTKGSVLENALGRDFGDAEFEGKSWVTAQDLSAYLTQQGLQEERNRTALGWETLNRQFPKADTTNDSGISSIYDKTSSLVPYQESDFKNFTYDISRYISEAKTKLEIGNNFGTTAPYMKEGQKSLSAVEMGGKYAKQRLDKEFDTALSLAENIQEVAKKSDKLSKMEYIQLINSIESFKQKYIHNPRVGYETDDSGKAIGDSERTKTSYLGELSNWAKKEKLSSDYINRLNKIKQLIMNAESLIPGITPVNEFEKSKYSTETEAKIY